MFWRTEYGAHPSGMYFKFMWKQVQFYPIIIAVFTNIILNYHRRDKEVIEMIDINFDFRNDSYEKDPDVHSSTLKSYHKILWSKPLPNGKIFNLRDDKAGAYLYHKSELGEYFLGSDAISHSYRHHKRKQWLTGQIPEIVNKVYSAGCKIGAYIIFPNNEIDKKQTINGARGFNSKIDDRFDLTLECIRRFYLGLQSPLTDIFLRYRDFFDLFRDFSGYVDFFLLQDLVTENYAEIKFYLPFDNFMSPPNFHNVHDYLVYQEKVIDFITKRNNRIDKMYNGGE
jgi:hypothetical protein